LIDAHPGKKKNSREKAQRTQKKVEWGEIGVGPSAVVRCRFGHGQPAERTMADRPSRPCDAFGYVTDHQSPALSRRDWVIVARQFIAWTCRETNPSRRDGMISLRVAPLNLGRSSGAATQLTPFPTGRIVSCVFPGNKLPGYLHPVPPGHKSQLRC